MKVDNGGAMGGVWAVTVVGDRRGGKSASCRGRPREKLKGGSGVNDGHEI